MRSIKGLEKVKIVRAGYAVEYDYVFPQQLKLSLAFKCLDRVVFSRTNKWYYGLRISFSAQGLMAGVNVAPKNPK